MVSIFFLFSFSTKGPTNLFKIYKWQTNALELESNYKIISISNFLISVVRILIAVAFYTILERKILSYIQIRKGPNKVGILGILQPFSDAIKLFNKNLLATERSNNLIFYLSPITSLLIAVLIISITPIYQFILFDNKFNLLLFFIISRIRIYSLLLVGWSSNSKYAYLGVIRRIAQIISYEVSFFLIILFIVVLANSFHFTQLRESQYYSWMILRNLILFNFWFIRCLAEVNRRPFDFAEGESELVSGFNVEFIGGWFARIFLAEYARILILAIITSALFFNIIKRMLSISFLIIIIILILWVRGTYPRFRYDFLILLRWKLILPSILFIIPLSLLINNLIF